MDREFWLNVWERGAIPFHGAVAHPQLVRHLPALSLSPGARIFLPLCGKTRDIGWLLLQGHAVAGAELSPLAVDQLFADLGVIPTRTPAGPLVRHSAPGIDIFAGDIFDLTALALGPVAATYDRAALVALPPEMRVRYARHLDGITGTAPQLLLSFDDGRAPDEGPPFAVMGDEIATLYGSRHQITLLEEHEANPDRRPRDVSTVWQLN
jgi:thiopurine S-methyltransferase